MATRSSPRPPSTPRRAPSRRLAPWCCCPARTWSAASSPAVARTATRTPRASTWRSSREAAMAIMRSADELKRLAREGMAEGLTLAAERVRAVATPLTPIQYGDLRSGHTVVPATADTLESAVTNYVSYAIYVHEDLSARHPVGQAKFLEKATRDSASDVEQIVGAAVKRKLA